MFFVLMISVFVWGSGTLVSNVVFVLTCLRYAYPYLMFTFEPPSHS